MDDLADTSNTRAFETIFGTRNYQQVSELLAEPLRLLLTDIAAGDYTEHPLDVNLLREFHRRIVVAVMPEIAGRWRAVSVRVGNHYPPPHVDVDREMRMFFDSLAVRLGYVEDDLDLQIEAFASAEAHILHVHPFRDFNGRAVRAFINEMMVRLDFPVVLGAVEQGSPEFDRYVGCLTAYDDDKSLVPLCAFWRDFRLA